MRERILARIRRGLEHRPSVALPEPLPLSMFSPEEAPALFSERLSGNGGEVVRLEGLEAAQEWLRTFAGVSLGQTVPEALHPGLPLPRT